MTGLPELSVSISSTHATNGPANMIERATTAHRAGYRTLSIGDHHDMAVPYAQNTPMLGRLLAEWPDRPVGCLFLMPLWPPLLMAEQIGTLAAIHHTSAPDQPFIVQTGLGRGHKQFTNLGADLSTRGRFVEAAIPAVQRLLAGEAVTDERFGLDNATVGLRSNGPLEWWVGAGADAGIDRAARVGDVWYAGPGADDDTLRRRIDRYRTAGGSRVALRIDAAVATNSGVAIERAEALVARGYRGMSLPQLLVGSPDEAADRAASFASIGVDELVIRCAAAEQEHALETLESLAGPWPSSSERRVRLRSRSR